MSYVVMFQFNCQFDKQRGLLPDQRRLWIAKLANHRLWFPSPHLKETELLIKLCTKWDLLIYLLQRDEPELETRRLPRYIKIIKPEQIEESNKSSYFMKSAHFKSELNEVLCTWSSVFYSGKTSTSQLWIGNKSWTSQAGRLKLFEVESSMLFV